MKWKGNKTNFLRYLIDEQKGDDNWVDKMDCRRTGKLMDQRVNNNDRQWNRNWKNVKQNKLKVDEMERL